MNNKKIPKIPQADKVGMDKENFHYTINYTVYIGNGHIAYTDDEFRAKTVERALKHWLKSKDAKLWWQEVLKKDGYK